MAAQQRVMTRIDGRFASLLARESSSEALIKRADVWPHSFMHWRFQSRRWTATQLINAASILEVDVGIVCEAARAGIPREFHPRTYGRLSVDRGLAALPALLHRPTAR